MKRVVQDTMPGAPYHHLSEDDRRIIDLLRPDRHAAENSGPSPAEEADYPTEAILDILRGGEQQYEIKAKKRIALILERYQEKPEADIDAVYLDTVSAFMRNIRAGKFRGDALLSTYLCGIAIRVAQNEKRRIEQRLKKEAAFQQQAKTAAAADHKEASRKETLFARLFDFIFQLDALDVELLTLAYKENLTDAEIAARTCRPRESLETVRERVKKRRQRALKKLRNMVREKNITL